MEGDSMKTKIILLALMVTVSLKAQSIITLGAGTSIEVQTGANLCADSINGSGLLFGDGTFCGGAITVVEKISSAELPTRFDMNQNYPNPFNPTTVITFQLPKASFVIIRLYDALGREIQTLYEAEQGSGYYSVRVSGTRLSAGVYFYKIDAREVSGQAGIFSKTLKMALIK
jgi:hypothetical protein